MKKQLKRALSLILTVVMLFTCWVFVAPKTNAATAGKYYVRVTWDVENKNSDSGNKMTLTYVKRDGSTATVSKTSCSSSETDGQTWDNALDGVPKAIEYRNYGSSTDACEWWIKSITVSPNSNYTTDAITVWSGTFGCYKNRWWGGTAINTYNIDTNAYAGWTDEGSSLCTTTDSRNWLGTPAAKYIDSLTASPTSLTTPLPNASNVTSTVSLGTVKDQYGVNWNQDAVAYVKTSATGMSLSGTTVSASSDAMMTASPWSRTIVIGARAGSASGTILSDGRTSSTAKTVSITTTNPSYTLTWNWYTSNSSSSSGTAQSTTSTTYYNQTPSAPSTATATTAYYTNSHHYTGGQYKNIPKTTNTSTKSFTMSYTTVAHGSWTYANVNASTHRKTCGGCAYNYTESHSGWTYANTNATQHTKTCGYCTYNTMENHPFTSQTKTNTYLKDAATCTTDAVYYYKCANCARAGSSTWTDTNSRLNHNYTAQDKTVEGTLVSAATCTEDAVYYYVCANNHSHIGTETWTDTNSRLSHNFNQEIVKNAALKSAATCTEPAVYYKSCANNNSHISSSNNDTFTSGSALNHNYESEITAPTCTEQGYTTYTCTRGDSEYVADYTSAIGHAYNSEEAPVKTIDTDSEKAVAYYPCTREGCDHKSECKVIDNAGTPKWVAAEDPIYEETEGTEITEDTLPTSDVKCGGAAIRIPGTYQSGDTVRTGMRYLVTMDIPEGARLVDFGVLYTLTPLVVKDEYIPIQGTYAKTNFGVEDSTGAKVPIPAAVDGDKVTFEYANAHSIKLAGVSYARSGSKANFTPVNHYSVYTGKQGSGSQTTIDAGNAQSIKFNCVITGLADNLATASLNKLTYARLARGYVTYEYLGQEFTIYDNVMTARSMGYIARQITTVGKDIETRHTIQYAQSILDAIAAKGGSWD